MASLNRHPREGGGPATLTPLDSRFRGNDGRVVLVLLLLLLLTATNAHAATASVLLSTREILPGETLRVELDGFIPDIPVRVVFLGKSYSLFPVGPNALRALIGVKLDAVPGSYALEFKSKNYPNSLPEPVMIEVTTRVFTTENVNFSHQKTALMKAEHQESLQIHQANKYLSRDQQWGSYFMYPVEGPVIGEFGLKRVRNGKIDAGFHKGIDLKAPAGTPLLAANAGTVVLASRFKAHGKTVLINHGQGVMTIYLHMESISVKLREKVVKGQEIGKVGSSGLSTAPHVHFQVFVHGVPVDPKQWVETEF